MIHKDYNAYLEKIPLQCGNETGVSRSHCDWFYEVDWFSQNRTTLEF